MVDLLDIVQILDCLDRPHHLEGVVSIQIELLLRNLPQPGLFRMYVPCAQGIADPLKGLDRPNDLDGILVLLDVIGPRVQGEFKCIVIRKLGCGNGKVGFALELPAHRPGLG